MAQKITTLFIDDIDGGAAEGTVRLPVDGADYEIDLTCSLSSTFLRVSRQAAAWTEISCGGGACMR
jgi:Lsr2